MLQSRLIWYKSNFGKYKYNVYNYRECSLSNHSLNMYVKEDYEHKKLEKVNVLTEYLK